LRSPKGAWRWLVRKEWRELMTSRSWWVMLALTGPLVGVSFISAVRSYAEISEGAGAACGAVCSPLTGIWAPTFGAYELASIFLLPFVAIRLVSGDRRSGALTIESQHSMPVLSRVATKMLVLAGGWLITGLAAIAAIGLWKSYGGSTSGAEIGAIAAGHLLNAGLTIAVATAAASIAEHPSTAAIATLAFTVGTWIVEFVAAVEGGVWSRLAGVTPVAMVADFQHGLVQASVVLAAIVVIGTGLGVAALWTRLAVPVRRRALETAALAAVAALIVMACTAVPGSWDASESRQSSFPEADAEALEHLTAPLAIEAHLAPVDPRRLELERRAFAKLRRVMPHVSITYVARTSSGLYEAQDPGYGEIWYAMDGRRVMNRVTTDEGVVEAVLEVAGVAPVADNEAPYLGHPLAAAPSGAALVFYVLWPALAGAAGFWVMRRHA
jgi:hypothetical protein